MHMLPPPSNQQMDARYRLFRRNQTVIDLGYAPGSWSQVAVERTKPHGVVVGIDLIPAQPPRGVTSIQGDFLSPQVRRLVRDVCAEQVRRRRRERREKAAVERRFEGMLRGEEEEEGLDGERDDGESEEEPGERDDWLREEGVAVGGGDGAAGEVVRDRPSYIDMEKMASHDAEAVEVDAGTGADKHGRMVDVSRFLCEECFPAASFF